MSTGTWDAEEHPRAKDVGARSSNPGEFASRHQSVATADFPVDDDSLFEMATAAGRVAHRRQIAPMVSADDVIQDTALALLEARADGRLPSDPLECRKYAFKVANYLSIDMRDELRPEDRNAMKRLRAMCDRSEQHLGRQLTLAEWMEGHDRVLAEWPDHRHRPTATFTLFAQTGGSVAQSRPTVSLDGMVDAFESRDKAAMLTDHTEVHHTIEPGSWADVASDHLEEGGKAALSSNRRMAWNILASTREVPLALPGLIPENRAKAYRKVLTDDRAVRSAAEAWLDGADDLRTTALFAPFEPGGPDPDIRARVVDALLEENVISTRAHAVWDGALMFANRRFEDTSRRDMEHVSA